MVPRKNERMWQGSEFPSTSKKGTLLSLYNMSLKLVEVSDYLKLVSAIFCQMIALQKL